MKSNLERDEVKSRVERQQEVIVQISQDKDRLFQEVGVVTAQSYNLSSSKLETVFLFMFIQRHRISLSSLRSSPNLSECPAND